MAKKLRKRGPTLEDKYIGLKPSYGDHNPLPIDPKEKLKEWRRGTYWFYYKQNKPAPNEYTLCIQTESTR